MNPDRWTVPEAEQEKYTSALAKELPRLRKLAKVSQTELCNMVGISRQTLSAVERGATRLTWNTYLSLILFFDYDLDTRDVLRSLPAYPSDYFLRMNDGRNPNHTIFASNELQGLIRELDEQALHSLRTLILVEYARCKDVAGETVVKAFDGIRFPGTGTGMAIESALANIRNKKHGQA